MTTTQDVISKAKLRKDDTVQVISGKEKGKTGKVLRVDEKNARILVDKVNMVKRHVKPNQKNPGGGVIEKELPVHYSNVLLVCPKCNKGSRFGFKLVAAKAKKAGGEAGKQQKVRVCKRCDTQIDAA